ncbi:hypothetical protein FEM08_11990 [Flavobacterium gilvum]|nr:hypothetical protein FEM08_11990 [Flavobacterium gilvum]
MEIKMDTITDLKKAIHDISVRILCIIEPIAPPNMYGLNRLRKSIMLSITSITIVGLKKGCNH